MSSSCTTSIFGLDCVGHYSLLPAPLHRVGELLSTTLSLSRISKFACLLLLLVLVVPATSIAQVMQGPTTIRSNVHHDVSLPLSVMVQNAPPVTGGRREAEAWKRVPLPSWTTQLTNDSVQQTLDLPTIQSPAVGLSFEGLGQGQYGFTIQFAPPDTNGAVGATQYVQWVNASYIIFDKTTGAKVLGPAAGNSLWAGFGGPCQTTNSGDPVVQYDKLANRWVLSQFAIVSKPQGHTCSVLLFQRLRMRRGLITAIRSRTQTSSTIIRRWVFGQTPTTKRSTCSRRPDLRGI